MQSRKETSVKKIFIDCDNTMGIEGHPMDDGLTILYLLGCPTEAEIIGIGCNFGNGMTAETFHCTRELLKEANRTDIPLLMGAEKWEDPCSEASKFIVQESRRLNGELVYLGLGSLGNLYGAMKLDPGVIGRLSQIVLMGGITEPLFIHQTTPLNELNFSVFYEASCAVLNSDANISVITGNNCLPVSELPKDEFMDKMCLSGNPAGMYIAKKCGYRFHDKEVIYGANSSYFWDGVAAAYVLHPELFTDHETPCVITENNLQTGFLNPVQDKDKQPGKKHIINLPTANDRKNLQDTFYRGWLNLKVGKEDLKFSCNGVYLDRLLQPAILSELAKEPAHGFLLLQRLKDNGLSDESLDPAGFYRRLKKLEKDQCLTSTMENVSGKARRVYSITDFGRRNLLAWEETLNRYQQHVQRVLDAIRAAK